MYVDMRVCKCVFVFVWVDGNLSASVFNSSQHPVTQCYSYSSIHPMIFSLSLCDVPNIEVGAALGCVPRGDLCVHEAMANRLSLMVLVDGGCWFMAAVG